MHDLSKPEPWICFIILSVDEEIVFVVYQTNEDEE